MTTTPDPYGLRATASNISRSLRSAAGDISRAHQAAQADLVNHFNTTRDAINQTLEPVGRPHFWTPAPPQPDWDHIAEQAVALEAAETADLGTRRGLTFYLRPGVTEEAVREFVATKIKMRDTLDTLRSAGEFILHVTHPDDPTPADDTQTDEPTQHGGFTSFQDDE